MKKLLKQIKYLLLLSFFVFLPHSVFASTVYIDTNHSDFFVGDSIIFNIRVNSESKSINTVEGNVLLNYLSESASLIDINTSNSNFSLWPSKPLPSVNNTNISFAGGVPGGLNSKDAIVFNIVLKLQKAGQIILTPDNIGVYLNDGKGTKDEISVKNLVIDVLPKKSDSQSVDDWNSLISNDKTPPEPFEIYLGQEGSVFDGKKFLSFSTTDKQSEVAYYEVLEGDLPPVRSSDTYILQEQNKPVKVTILAYDSAGNARKSEYNPATSNILYHIIIFIILTIFIIPLIVIFKRKKRSP